MLLRILEQRAINARYFCYPLEKSTNSISFFQSLFQRNILVTSLPLNFDYSQGFAFMKMPKNKKLKNKTVTKTKTTFTNKSANSSLNSHQNTFVNSESAAALGKKRSVKKKKKKNNDPISDVTTSMAKLSVSSYQKHSKKTTVPSVISVRNKSYSAGSTRTSGPRYESLEDIAKYIKSRRARNIIVMCGAGISTASGIPDFRTPGTGLYHNLQKYNIPTPTAVFDMEYFRMKPKPFFELAKELYPSGKYRPNMTHYFLRTLHDKGLLLRLYTQNIDGLERLAGIPSVKLVEAHGTFATASCIKCGKKYNGESIKERIFKNIIPRCDVTPLCWGTIKPDIVFFGEDLPKRFYYYLKDFPLCDLLIVIGTSLEVEPFAGLVDSVRHNVPRLLINRDRVGPFKPRGRPTDVFAPGDIVRSIERFSTLLGWKKLVAETMSEHEKLSEKEFFSDTQTDSGISSASSVSSEVKESTSTTSLPPPSDNIKRYFHTIRSTPLPKSKSNIELGNKAQTSTIPSSLSYFEFIRSQSKNDNAASRTKQTEKPLENRSWKTDAPTIRYAQTVGKQRFSRRKQNCTSAPCTQFDYDSTDSSDTTSSDSSSG